MEGREEGRKAESSDLGKDEKQRTGSLPVEAGLGLGTAPWHSIARSGQIRTFRCASVGPRHCYTAANKLPPCTATRIASLAKEDIQPT